MTPVAGHKLLKIITTSIHSDIHFGRNDGHSETEVVQLIGKKIKNTTYGGVNKKIGWQFMSLQQPKVIIDFYLTYVFSSQMAWPIEMKFGELQRNKS